MTALKIIIFMLGLAFTLFGYFILFRKKYSLINGFNEEYNAGRKTEEYAKRVGFVEFIIGIFLLITAVIILIVC